MVAKFPWSSQEESLLLVKLSTSTMGMIELIWYWVFNRSSEVWLGLVTCL